MWGDAGLASIALLSAVAAIYQVGRRFPQPAPSVEGDAGMGNAIAEWNSDDSQALIRAKARRLVGMDQRRRLELDDIEQVFRIKLWKASQRYDSSQASFETFASTVLDRLSANLIRDRRGSKHLDDSFGSLQAVLRNKDGSVVESQELGTDRRRPRRESTAKEADRLLGLSLDLDALLTTLGDRDRQACEAVMRTNVTDAARDLGVPRSTLVDRLRRLGPRFEHLSEKVP